MSDLIKELELRFSSKNDIDVERAHLTKPEFESVKMVIHDLKVRVVEAEAMLSLILGTIEASKNDRD